jgi:hypothetical protein
MATNAACGAMCPFAAPCCALESDGACQGSLGQDASVGLGSLDAQNAFDPFPIVFPSTPPNVIDRMPVRTRIENVSGYATCHAIVVDECECAGEPDGAACNDGDACSALDVCLGGICLGTNRMVCNASDQCHIPGVCDALAGTCSNPPKPDGTACEDGAICTVADSCQAGVCVTGGPGPDADGDGVCNALDLCPADADPAQSDVDADGLGDACDAVDAPLDLLRAVLRRRGTRGTITVRGTFEARSSAEAFGAAEGIAVRVRNGGAVDEQHAWAPNDCRTSAKGRIVCVGGKTARARFRPAAGSVHRFRIALGRAAIAPTFDASVGVVLTYGAHLDRAGSLAASTCKARGAQLRCRR